MGVMEDGRQPGGSAVTPHPASATLAVACLGSGSDGNATIVRHGDTAVLVDCGFSPPDLTRRLHSVGLGPGDLAGIVVTHEHGDHCRGLESFALKHSLPVFLSQGTARGLRWSRPGRRPPAPSDRLPSYEVLAAGRPLWLGALQVSPLVARHDAREPLAFRFDTAGGLSFGYITDTGSLPGETLEALRGCRMLGVEANHCPELLRSGPYPAFLKRRIHSDHGHLSNQACAEGLALMATADLEAVLALHLSKVNNRASLATRVLADGLATLGLSSAVHAQGPSPGRWLSVGWQPV